MLPDGHTAHPALKPAGLTFVELDHDGCAQRSEPEADEIARLYAELLAPLAGEGVARVGTVDRFQGQEAEAVLVSMTTSDAESMPRDATFLLSRNRFNVAISRARCLAVVVASSGLLDLDARSVEEMRLANLLCRARAEADGGP